MGRNMIGRLRTSFLHSRRSPQRTALRFDRPLVLFQSDDWGRAGVPDRSGWDALQAVGINLGVRPYDFYSLETAEDVRAVARVLNSHCDSTHRSPSFVMNFIMANVEFDHRFLLGQKQISLRPLTKGFPQSWNRSGLLEAYRQGIRDGVFYPALHGLTHFCEQAVLATLNSTGERSQLLEKMWGAQTAYIHWRMPWIGYEYWDAEKPPTLRFLLPHEQRTAIQRASEIFLEFFAAAPFSACAPGYRANPDTRTAWFENGIRIAQNGPGDRQAPYIDEHGMLFTFRTVEMEPALDPACDLTKLMASVSECFARGVPAVISTHSINYHSTLRDFRTPTLQMLDELLTGLEREWPNLLYVDDADLFSIATTGEYAAPDGNVKVQVTTTGIDG